MTKDEAQRRRWTFYEAVKIEEFGDSQINFSVQMFRFAIPQFQNP